MKPLILSSGSAELAKDNLKLGHLLTVHSDHLGTSHFKNVLSQAMRTPWDLLFSASGPQSPQRRNMKGTNQRDS